MQPIIERDGPISLPVSTLASSEYSGWLRGVSGAKGNTEEFGAQKLDSRSGPSIETPARISARYFPSKVESSNDGQRRCFVCNRTTRDPMEKPKTSYEYKVSNVGLC